MTVKDLVKLLQSYPKDMFVVDANNNIFKKEYIYIPEKFYNGDSVNSNCEILYDVLKND